MKKRIFLSMLVLLTASLISFTVNCQSKKATKSIVTKAHKIEIYYFHYTRRCITCQAVETETQAAVLTLYPAQSKKGEVTFKSVNLDDKSSDILAKKCKVEGQALLIIEGSKRIDLTEQGFMYAKNNPEKLRAELKKTIDKLL
jgi:hypothetical protein